MKEYIIPDDFLEYSNDNKFVAEISQESINDLFACVLDNIRTIKYKEFKEKDNNADS